MAICCFSEKTRPHICADPRVLDFFASLYLAIFSAACEF